MNRKIGLLVLSLALAGSLVGCGNQNASVDPTPTAPAVAPDDSAAPSGTPEPRTGNTVGKGMEDAMRNAGDVARGAIDGIDDAARGAMEGLEDAARRGGNPYNWNGEPALDGYYNYGWGTDGSVMENGGYYAYNVH